MATGNDDTDKANVQRELRQVLKRKSTLNVVHGRGFEVGDTAIVDFEAARADTGEVFPGATRSKTQLDSDSADVEFLPGECLWLCCALPCHAMLRCAWHAMLQWSLANYIKAMT